MSHTLRAARHLRPAALGGLLLLLIVGLPRASRPSVMAVEPERPSGGVAVERPAPRSIPTMAPARRFPGVDAREVWNAMPDELAPRGPSACSFDNGAPLDDFGDPASQWSENAMEPEWDFFAAAADDFMVGNLGDTDLCRITLIRAAFLVSGPGDPSPTNTWEEVIVTVYADAAGEPGGLPDGMGGQTGEFKVSQFVPVASLLNETLVGECRPCHVVDIPVNFLVKKGVKYWLSIVPIHTGPPHQSFWCLSTVETSIGDEVAKQMFTDFIPNWADIEGNFGQICPGVPPPETNRNLSFQIITAVSEPDREGACCDDTIGDPSGCAENKSIVDCQKPDDRFAVNTLCMDLDPECGTTNPRACCLPSGSCVDELTPTECAQLDGQWIDDECENLACPPLNESCEDQLVITGNNVSLLFDTTHSQPGDGLPLTSCGEIVHDLWFSYQVPCDGTVAIDTAGSGFDTVLAIYGPAGACPVDCPTTDFSEMVCSDDIPNSTDSYVLVPALTGQCLLIRVGGKPASPSNTGPGVLNIQCIDTGLGACCHGDDTCDLLPEAACTAPGDLFFEGEPCTIACQTTPENDTCEEARELSGEPVSFLFDTTHANTEADAPLTACGEIVNDIWFSYEAPCDGTVVIRTQDSTFDTVIAVYGPAMECPVDCPEPSPDGDFSEWACNDDGGEGTDAYLVLPVAMGECLLIRVGGKVGGTPSGGLGVLHIDCIPAGFGACCHADQTCEIVESADCTLPTDLFTPGQPCVAGVTCPPACCVGDMNDDCMVDTLDVPFFVEALLDPAALDADAFCRADVNRDLVVDGLDIAPFVARVLAMARCVTCCPGDTNGDGLIDGLDIQGLIDALFDPPHCSTLAFCRADVNEDLVIDLQDVEALVLKLLAGDKCP